MIRQPICTVVGHIDHGKTSILDTIRGTAVTKGEAGGITQAISSTSISLGTIKKISGKLLDTLKLKLTIPGLLFIDTPGHAAFNNLRKRGGNLADIAILVVNINEGMKEQSLECIKILKEYKTPFIIALNKIDLISGWQNNVKKPLMENINSQGTKIQEQLDKKLYEILGQLAEQGLNSERFDRVGDYTQQIAMVPVSAATGEGMPELLMILTGLAQKYLEKKLEIEVKGPGKGVVLEVKEEKGLGKTLDVILHDGTLKEGDKIIIGGLDKPISTKVKALFEPATRGKKLKKVKKVSAAIGVKINAPDIEDVISGMPIQVANKDLEKIKKDIQKEVSEVLLETDKEGIVIKADSLGSLEALTDLLKREGFKIKKASIGDINKKDLMAANSSKDELNKVVLGFNIKVSEKDERIRVIVHEVIYRIIDEYKGWIETEKKRLESKELENLTSPCKVQILPGCVFRQSNPAVVGVSVIAGKIKSDTPLMKEDGSKVASVGGMQSEGENVSEAEKNKEVAISLPGITVGRQIEENDILLSDVPEDDFIKLKKLKKYLNKSEIELLKEIALIKRRENPVWGV